MKIAVPRVVVGWHDFGSTLGDFTESLVNMTTYSGRLFSGTMREKSCYLTAARNLIVHKFLKSPAEFLLMVDADLTFPPDSLNKTFAAQQLANAPIMFGNYCLGDGRASIFGSLEHDGLPRQFDVMEPNSIYEVTAGATGWALMRRDALEEMRKVYAGDSWPWFNHDYIKDADRGAMLLNNIGEYRLGEDITFSKRAREAGIKMYGYTGLTLVHHKVTPLLNDFMKGHVESLGVPVS